MASSPLRAQLRTSTCHLSCQPRAHVPSKQWPKPTVTAGTAGTNYIGASSYSRDHAPLHANKRARPRTNEVTLSILRRAKESGFTALVVTLDTFLVGLAPARSRHSLPTLLSRRRHTSWHFRPRLHATDGQPLWRATPRRASSVPA